MSFTCDTNSALTLTDTETDTDKLAQGSVSVQYEHFHTNSTQPISIGLFYPSRCWAVSLDLHALVNNKYESLPLFTVADSQLYTAETRTARSTITATEK